MIAYHTILIPYISFLPKAAARASIDTGITSDGWSPIAMAAEKNNPDCVTLLAYLGARLHMLDGRGFWVGYASETRINKGKGELACNFWPTLVHECGDDGSEESLTKRRAMLKANKMYDPRD